MPFSFKSLFVNDRYFKNAVKFPVLDPLFRQGIFGQGPQSGQGSSLNSHLYKNLPLQLQNNLLLGNNYYGQQAGGGLYEPVSPISILLSDKFHMFHFPKAATSINKKPQLKVGGVVVGSWAQGAPNRTLITTNRARYPINKQRIQKGGRVTIQAPGNQNCYRIMSNVTGYNYNSGVGHQPKSVQKLRVNKGQKLTKANNKGGSAINKNNLKNKTKAGVTATEEKKILKKSAVEETPENGMENLTENVEKMSLKTTATITSDPGASCKENG